VNELVTVKTKAEKEAIKERARKAWTDALDGKPPYLDVEAVVENERFNFKTPILHMPLSIALDKPRPSGEKVTLRMSAIEITSWDNLWVPLLEIESDKTKSVVYVLLMENDTVKIGRSEHFERRMATISTSSGLNVKKYWHTDKLTRNEASRIETQAHRHFKQDRRKGEFFNIDFKRACGYVKGLLQTPS
jgi:hypothetical protein